jgi:DNA-binding IclR family transcriptional regulator
VTTGNPPLDTAGQPSHDRVPSTRSVHRALALLEVLGCSAVPLRMSDLALAAELSKATVHRILKSLLAHGFVAKVGLGYTLGERFLELAASGSADTHGLERSLRPFLLELYELTHGVVSLAVLHHLKVVYPDVLHHRSLTPAPWFFGKAVPAHRTSAGRLLLAYRPTVIEWASSLELACLPDADLTGLNELLCELPLIHARGLAWGGVTESPGEVEVAAPVVGADGRVLAALSVSGPVERIEPHTASLHALRVARSASASLQRPPVGVPVEPLGVTSA